VTTIIQIAGPIGVGKTCFAQMLSARLSAHLISEQDLGTEHLGPFYEDMSTNAFDAQRTFLLGRLDQLMRIPDASDSVFVVDYYFDKERIFADLLLAGPELARYNCLYRYYCATVPEPSVVVYLRARAADLERRIRARGIPYEASISLDYLEKLARAYDHYFAKPHSWPVLIFDVDERNIDELGEPLERLVGEIEQVLGARAKTV